MRSSTSEKPHSQELRKVYLFLGESDLRRQSAIDDLIKQAVDPDFTAFDLEKFDGNDCTAENIIAAATTIPLGSQRKTIVVERVDRLSPDEQVMIAGIVPRLGDRACLIMSASEDASANKQGRSSAGKKQAEDDGADDLKGRRQKGLQSELVKAVKTHGLVITFEKLRADALSSLVRQAIARTGKKIELPALESLTRYLAGNSASVATEVEKLAAYVGDRDKITASDVDAVVTKSPEDRIFQLINAIATRQPERALHMLNETLSASGRPDDEVPRVLAMIARQFRLLYQAKYIKNMTRETTASTVPEDLQAMLARDHNPLAQPDFSRRQIFEQADAFTMDELRRYLKHVLVCELSVKGLGNQGGTPRLNLEMLVLRLSQPRVRTRV